MSAPTEPTQSIVENEVGARLHRKLEAAEARAAMLREALDLVVDIQNSPEVQAVYTIAHAHGVVYRGRAWEGKVTAARNATDADVTAWLQARERAAAEKMREACAKTFTGFGDVPSLIRVIDVDEVLKGNHVG